METMYRLRGVLFIELIKKYGGVMVAYNELPDILARSISYKKSFSYFNEKVVKSRTVMESEIKSGI